jgi:hypothetical protein
MIDPAVYVTLLRIYDVFTNFLEGLYSFTVRTTQRVALLTYEQKYVFFTGYTTPYDANKVALNKPGIPSIAWVYNLETNVISDSAATSTATRNVKSLPWLSAAIRYNGLQLYSLDGFINTVKYSSERAMPPPAIIVGSWTIQTGIVLDNKLTLSLFVITDHGEEREVSPWSLAAFDGKTTETVAEAAQLQATQPEAAQPEAAQPEAAQPEAAQPEVPKHDATRPAEKMLIPTLAAARMTRGGSLPHPPPGLPPSEPIVRPIVPVNQVLCTGCNKIQGNNLVCLACNTFRGGLIPRGGIFESIQTNELLPSTVGSNVTGIVEDTVGNLTYSDLD